MEEENKVNFWVLIVDKLIIALIVGVAIWYLEHYSSIKLQDSQQAHEKQLLTLQGEIDRLRIQREQDFELELAALKKEFDNQAEIKRLERELKKEFQVADKELENRLKVDSADVKFQDQKDINKKRLDYLSLQLSEFYWPIRQRLEKNAAVLGMMGHDLIGNEIARSVVLPNHKSLLKIFEEKMHLAEASAELTEEIRKYIAHVHLYESLINGNIKGFPEDYKGGQGYPEKLYPLIKRNTDTLQARYHTMLLRTKLIDSPIEQGTYSETTEPQEGKLNSFDYQVFRPTIKQSYTDNKFIVYLDQDTKKKKIRLILDKYIWENKIGIFKIEDSTHPPVRNEAFFISKDAPFEYEANNRRVYRIHLNEAWEQRMKTKKIRKRTLVSVKVESWKMPEKKKTEQPSTQSPNSK